MIKIFLVLILLSIFILLIVLLVKQAKEKSYEYDNIIFAIIDFIIEEDLTIGILFVIIVLVSIIVFGL